MSRTEIRLELAVGRRVRAKNGRPIGRLEQVVAGDDWVVREYHIGAAAFLERLGVHARSLFGFKARPHGFRARWDQLDVSDPRHPRLTCALEQLAPFTTAAD